MRLLNKTEGYGGYWDCSTKLKGLEVNEIFNKTEGFGGYNEIIKQNRRVRRLMRLFNKTEGFGG